MKKMICKQICIFICLIIAGSMFAPVAVALRGNGASSAAVSRSAEIKSEISGRADTSLLRDFEIAKASIKADFRRGNAELSNGLIPPINQTADDEVPEDVSDDEFYVSDTWILGSYERTLTNGAPQASMNRITLALASTSPRSITIVASASASGVMEKMGVCVLRLQRYYKGRWVSVVSITNRYSYDVSYFFYSGVQNGSVSGSYYRVIGTFIGDNGSYETCVTRTSRSIRCQ